MATKGYQFMSIGQNEGNTAGFTMVELMLSLVLLSVIFLSVTSLYMASQDFYFNTDERAMVGYELQYALKHINNNVMKAVGDEHNSTSSAFNIPNIYTLNIYISNNTPFNSTTYHDVTTYTYCRGNYTGPSAAGTMLMFTTDSVNYEPLNTKITILDVNFTRTQNLLEISLTGRYRTKNYTVHSSCYPRMSSFQ